MKIFLKFIPKNIGNLTIIKILLTIIAIIKEYNTIIRNNY